MTVLVRSAVAIMDLPGVWRRDILVEPDGRRDEASAVYWLQALTLYGDIRLEGGTEDEARRMTAFAGRLSERDGVFRWERTLLTPPADGPPDDGRLVWDREPETGAGGILREDGVHAPYWETWRRIAAPSADDFAAELFEPVEGRRGFLVTIGGFAFFGVSAASGGGMPAFALRGEGQEGTIALSAGAPGWDFEAEIPAGAWARTVHIAETDVRGHAIARDWRVAALEYPSAPAARQVLQERTA
jgi:hypothetical protein